MDIQQLHLIRLVVCGLQEYHDLIIADAIDLLREHQQTETISCLNGLEAGLMWLYHTTNDAILATLKSKGPALADRPD